MALPKKKCPECGSTHLGAWASDEGSGQFCTDCDWEEDHYEEPDPDGDDYKPTGVPNHVEVP
jgi:hypothetical protein